MTFQGHAYVACDKGKTNRRMLWGAEWHGREHAAALDTTSGP